VFRECELQLNGQESFPVTGFSVQALCSTDTVLADFLTQTLKIPYVT
jgi:hypothetical protein